MRYAEFVAHPYYSDINRFEVCTLYVPEESGFADLNQVRIDHGDPTRILGVRSLEPRFRGYSVDVACGSPEEAVRLLLTWYALCVGNEGRVEIPRG
jgi:hypothetical protein